MQGMPREGAVPQKTGIVMVKVERGSVSANAAAYHVLLERVFSNGQPFRGSRPA